MELAPYGKDAQLQRMSRSSAQAESLLLASQQLKLARWAVWHCDPAFELAIGEPELDGGRWCILLGSVDIPEIALVAWW